MAVKGDGIDITLKCGASVSTSTSQYLCVGNAETTTSADFTVIVTNDSTTAGTTAARWAVGINQTKMSTGMDACTVRVSGVSKAIAAASIPAFSWVMCYEGGSTTTRRGQIQAVALAETFTAMTTSAHQCVLGRALEDASTNTTIQILLAPQLFTQNMLSQ